VKKPVSSETGRRADNKQVADMAGRFFAPMAPPAKKRGGQGAQTYMHSYMGPYTALVRMTRAIVGLALIAGVMAQPVQAAPPAFDDFTFKRVKPPKAGGKRRINVQITDPLPPPGKATAPKPQATPQATPVAALTPTGQATQMEWFWSQISPDLSASGPGRLEPALRHLANAPQGQAAPEPRLDLLMQIARDHGRDILMSTVGTQVSPALVLAVIAVESSGQSGAQSHAGAAGLMQLMPATAERFDVTDRLDPGQSIRGGTAFLDHLMGAFDHDPILVLAGYNAGESAVRKNDGVPPYAETRDYVPKVLAAFKVARGVCMTPPELITDGCVFRRMK
jgi:hypothetical protein